MASHLKSVSDAMSTPVDDPAFNPANDEDHGGGHGGWGRPPKAMPEGCPVIPLGTEDGVFYFLTALGELRGLTCDKVANKHIVGMFAPDSDYLIEQWPRKKLVKSKDADGNEVEDWIVTGWRNDDVAMLLMDVGAAQGVWSARERVRGRGAWKDDDGALILHSGNHVMIGGEWRRPGKYADMVYPTAPAIPKPAAQAAPSGEAIAPKLVGSLRARDIVIAQNASPARVLLELFKTWNWARPMIDPMILLGWNGAAMLGGALDYRPLAWITGDKATGKSALQKAVGHLHDGGILQSPDATEAAVRQVLGQQSLPVGIDEAEADKDNRKILALVKLARLAATSQGNIMRGGQDHKGHEFQATSCFLFSSILVPPIPSQDKSRLAVLELGRLPAGQREPQMDKRELAALGAALRRRLVDRWAVWPATLEAYKDALIEFGEHGGRVSDQFGSLLAAAHILLEDDAPDAEALIHWGRMLAVDQLAETSDESDEATRCIHHLATSLVQLAGHGTPRQVSEWILQATEPLGVGMAQPGTMEHGEAIERRKRASDMLAKIGMRIVTGKARAAHDDRPGMTPGRDYLAVAASGQGLAGLFRDTHYADGVWTQALKRLPGALANQNQRISGISTKCTLIPVDVFLMREEEPTRARQEEEA